MDVSAVCKGNGKGLEKKNKGKNKEKDKEEDPAANPDAEMICYYCHRKKSPQARLRNIRERHGQEGCERCGASACIDARGRCGALGDTITSEHDRAG